MQKIMKHVPNALSFSRIIVAAILFTFNDLYNHIFLALYVYCALTDFLDGKIARKYHCESKIGTALDTIGDAGTYLALLKILATQKMVPGWIVTWLLVAVGFAVIAAFITFIRFKKFFLPHTIISKILGGMVFGLPIVVQVIPVLTWMTIIGIMATISVIEILLMQTLCVEAEDALSIFHTMKNRKANKK